MAVIAIDCASVRALHSRPEALTGELDDLIYGSMPTANLLAVAIVLLFRRRANRSPFLMGFVGCGCLALSAHACLAVFAKDAIDQRYVSTLNFIDRLTNLDLMSRPWAVFAPPPALSSLGQVVVALGGGWLARKVGGGSAMIPADEPRRRLRLGSMLAIMALVAMPGLALEGYFRRTIDPRFARLAVGSEAVLDVENSTGFVAVLSDETPLILPNGTTVRVDADDKPPLVGPILNPNPTPVGDLRTVHATILDGRGAAKSTRLMRHFLLSVPR